LNPDEESTSGKTAVLGGKQQEGSVGAAGSSRTRFWLCALSGSDGQEHDQAKPMKGFGSAGMLEIVEDWERNTYRAIYTVRFVESVFVLHVFQKKSRRGVATPKRELDLIRERWKTAEQMARKLVL
jgi:phage-related protein